MALPRTIVATLAKDMRNASDTLQDGIRAAYLPNKGWDARHLSWTSEDCTHQNLKGDGKTRSAKHLGQAGKADREEPME